MKKSAPVFALDEDDDDEDDDDFAPKLGELLVESGHVTEDDVKEALKKQKPLGQILAEDGKVEREKIDLVVQRQAMAKEREASRKKQEALRITSYNVCYTKLLRTDVAYLPAERMDAATSRARLLLGPGQEGCWFWPDLHPDHFQSHCIAWTSGV